MPQSAVLARRPAANDDPPATTLELLKLFLAEKHDPDPFYIKLADRSVATLPFDLDGAKVLDLGCGAGHYAVAMRERGSDVIGLDLDREDVAATHDRGVATLIGDGCLLPFPDASFDGVFCSNMLEHTPTPMAIIAEIERVLRPGGWAWVSWTNWYSPWGGHEIVPLHYLGPNLGLRAWRRLFGEPRKNVPFDALWPTYIGRTLRDVRARPGLRLVDALPRYYPSQRWILKVPGFREVFTWNCLLIFERSPRGARRAPAA